MSDIDMLATIKKMNKTILTLLTLSTILPCKTEKVTEIDQTNVYNIQEDIIQIKKF